MDAYLTTSDARILAASLPGMTAFLALSDAAMGAGLLLASIDIDAAMRYQGRRFDLSSAQTLEFPRIPYVGSLQNPLSLRVLGIDGLLMIPPDSIWDWDETAGDPPGTGAAIVPPAVLLACVLQAAWITSSGGIAAQKRLEAIRSGLAMQQIGTAEEQYAPMAAVDSVGLCDRATRIMEKYRLRSGQML